MQRQFTELEKQEAKKIVDQYIALRENQNIDYDADFQKFEDLKKSEFYYAVPSQFHFNFPEDVYNNVIPDEGLDGADTLIKHPENGSFNFVFVAFDERFEPDHYSSDLLIDLLPKYFDVCDEYHFEFTDYDMPNAPKDLTIKDVYKYLLSLGFTYKAEGNYNQENEPCLFREYLS